MAGFPPLSYKASELSPGEIELSKLAANTATSAFAMPLLFGAAALRRGAASDAADAYNQDMALSLLKEANVRRGQDLGTIEKFGTSTSPGALAYAASNPLTRDIIGGGSSGDINPAAASIIDAITGGQFRKQNAEIAKDALAAAYSGVQSGNRMAVDTASGLAGVPLVQTAPEQEILTGMREAGANARHAQDKLTASVPMLGVAPGPSPAQPLVVTGHNIHPSMTNQVLPWLASLNAAINAPQQSIGAQGGTGQFNLPQMPQLPGLDVPMVGKNKVPTGATATIPLGNMSTPAGAAGAALPPARTQPPAPRQPQTSSAEPGVTAAPSVSAQTPTPGSTTSAQTSGASVARGLPTFNVPANVSLTPVSSIPQQLLERYGASYINGALRRQDVDEASKTLIRKANTAGVFGAARDANGHLYLTVGRVPVAPIQQ